MSAGGDFLIKTLRGGGPIANAFLSAFNPKSSAEEEADKIQDQRIQNAQNELEFNKGVDSRNQQTIDDLFSQLFGGGASGGSYGGSVGAGPGIRDKQGNILNDGFFQDPLSGKYVNLKTGENVDAATAINPNPSAPVAAPAGKTLHQNPTGFGNVSSSLVDATKDKQQSMVKPWTLPGAYKATEDELTDNVNDYVDSLNAIKDPNLVNYVGDVQSQANVSDQARQAEGYALDKLKGFTDVKETAEEKLMRELARRKMEGQMKGDRDAMAQQLKARGVYGSGAELAGQLNSQGESASRRALEELAAQANAQQRAMQALGQYSTAAQGLGNQDLEAGRLHDLVSEFNNNSRAQNDQFRAKQEADNNQAKTARATAQTNAKNRVTSLKDTHTNDLTNVLTTLGGMKVGANNAGAAIVDHGIENLDPGLAGKQASALANDETGTSLLGLGQFG
jgi:hypothetical protein